MNGVFDKSRLSDTARWVLTIILGMLVIFWRIILPTKTEITVFTVILVMILDLGLTAAVVFLNRKDLKEAWIKKFALKDILVTLLLFVIFVVANVLFGLTSLVTISGVPLHETMTNNPDSAVWVMREFFKVFPMGIIISTVIAAPIWEEIVFRMVGKNLLKNPILFLIIASCCLYSFIHTVNFSILDNMTYLFFGLLFGVMYLVTKDIRKVTIVHALWNIVAMSNLFLA
ncbi:MAG: CPBP family intramembrane metalloprotease [Oscillospiraceae bacterium]|jgi:membrane protease YdiL (CAAX protease family)|nr:CPBP family intramembrane metalloprotease [Oscillospiraceae bacterium]